MLAVESPRGAILIFDFFLNYLQKLDATTIQKIFKNISNTRIDPTLRRDYNFQAGLMYYYGVQCKEDIGKARDCLLFASKLTATEKEARRGFTADVNNLAREKYYSLLKSPTNTANRSEKISMIAAFVERLKAYRPGPEFFLTILEDKSSVYFDLIREARADLAEISRISYLREGVSKAVLACIDLIHGTASEKEGACAMLHSVINYGQNINVTELTLGELFLDGNRTISVRDTASYFEYLEVPEAYFKGGDEVALYMLPSKPKPIPRKPVPKLEPPPNLPKKTLPKLAPPANQPPARVKDGYSRRLWNATNDAVFWLETAAEHGEKKALFFKGLRHQLRSEDAEAFACYEASARCSGFNGNLGFPESLRALSLCYANGFGLISADNTKAFDLMMQYCVCSKILHNRNLKKNKNAGLLSAEGANFLHDVKALIAEVNYNGFTASGAHAQGYTFDAFLKSIAPPVPPGFISNLRGVAFYLLYLERTSSTYAGLSRYKPHALKIAQCNIQPFQQLIKSCAEGYSKALDEHVNVKGHAYKKHSSKLSRV